MAIVLLVQVLTAKGAMVIPRPEMRYSCSKVRETIRHWNLYCVVRISLDRRVVPVMALRTRN